MYVPVSVSYSPPSGSVLIVQVDDEGRWRRVIRLHQCDKSPEALKTCGRPKWWKTPQGNTDWTKQQKDSLLSHMWPARLTWWAVNDSQGLKKKPFGWEAKKSSCLQLQHKLHVLTKRDGLFSQMVSTSCLCLILGDYVVFFSFSTGFNQQGCSVVLMKTTPMIPCCFMMS